METATMLMITVIVLCPGIPLCKYQEDMASILYHLAQGKEAFLDYVKDSIFSHVRPQLGLPDDIWPCNLVERVAVSLLLHVCSRLLADGFCVWWCTS